MDELTTAIPKPMLDLAGRRLLEYKLDILDSQFESIVIIVGYEGDVIRNYFGGAYQGKPIHYAEQKLEKGTAGALWAAKDLLTDRFLVMMGDDVYAKEDIEQCLGVQDGWAVVGQGLQEMHRAGSIEVGEDGLVERIMEGDLGALPGLASTNMYLFDKRLFECPLVPKQAGSLEFGLPQTAADGAKAAGIPFHVLYTEAWIQINSPADLTHAAATLKALHRI